MFLTIVGESEMGGVASFPQTERSSLHQSQSKLHLWRVRYWQTAYVQRFFNSKGKRGGKNVGEAKEVYSSQASEGRRAVLQE